MVAALVVIMVVVGGFVRLSRAGLSIVEWDVVTGILPPIGEDAWEQSFAAYQQTPEYQIVNEGMTLGAYQRIFYIEWAHRLIARVVGLLVLIPLLWFHWKRRLTWRTAWRYWAVAALFAVQGVLGWVMVSSGLRDRPAVSHFRLTIHLLVALALLGMVLWMALDRMAVRRSPERRPRATAPNAGKLLSWAFLATLVIQIGYGGLVAGLKAGHVSNTWPLMFNRLVPPNLLSARQPWWINLFDPVGSHWVHRWLAFLVAAFAIALVAVILRDGAPNRTLRAAAGWLVAGVALQIGLGITVVVLGVPKWFALAHQAVGVALFAAGVTITHEIRARSTPGSLATTMPAPSEPVA